MIRGSIWFRNANNGGVMTACLLDDDGRWRTAPPDSFLDGWLNVDCSPTRFGPADGDPEIAAMEAANRVLRGNATLPVPRPGPGDGTVY